MFQEVLHGWMWDEGLGTCSGLRFGPRLGSAREGSSTSLAGPSVV